MLSLAPNPTFATLKRFAADADKRFDAFVQALDLFGREPGETWHPLADEFIGRVLELKKILCRFEGKASFPTAERREVAEQLGKTVPRLSGIQLQLRDRLIGECPPVQLPSIVDDSIETLWDDYDRPTFHALLQNTPLPRQGHSTLKTLQQKHRRKRIAESRTSSADQGIFKRFVEEVSASDPLRRKRARKELESLRDRSNDEKWGRQPGSEWEYSQDLLVIWDGVRASLPNPDPLYRRAALCALPVLQFTSIVDDSSEEVIPFVLQELQDPDGMVRYKLVRFGRDFFMVQRIDHARVADDFEKQVMDAYKKLPKDHAIRKSFRQLLKEIKTLRQFNLRRGSRPLVEADVL